jgi:hypothetical protein
MPWPPVRGLPLRCRDGETAVVFVVGPSLPEPATKLKSWHARSEMTVGAAIDPSFSGSLSHLTAAISETWLAKTESTLPFSTS